MTDKQLSILIVAIIIFCFSVIMIGTNQNRPDNATTNNPIVIIPKNN